MADLDNSNLPEKETAPTEETAKKDTKDVKAVTKPVKKDKVPLGKRIAKFFRDYKSELKKIVWCSPKQTVNYTGIVLVCIVAVSAFIGVLDFGFSKLLMAVAKLV